jgi:hypothetical protein
LAALEESRALNDVERLKALFPTALTPLFEANDLVTIHRGLQHAGLESYIKTGMQKIVSGPRSYIDEDPTKGSNEARNVTFELMVAERLHTGGLVLDPTLRADVAVKVGNRRALIECKRPQSERQLAQRVIEARDQLKRSYQSALRPGCYGLIAIDLTKLSNPDFGIMTGVEPGEVGMVMTKHIHDLYHENWRPESGQSEYLCSRSRAQYQPARRWHRNDYGSAWIELGKRCCHVHAAGAKHRKRNQVPR